MEQKQFYPKTFKVIKDLSNEGIRNSYILNDSNIYQLISTFMSEILSEEYKDKFIEVISNEKIGSLFKKFFLSVHQQYEFRYVLFLEVLNEYRILFNELFDEAHDENMNEIIGDFPVMLADMQREYLRSL